MLHLLRKRLSPFAVLFMPLAVAVLPGAAGAALPDDSRMGGRITAKVDGKLISFPALKTDIRADVQGDLATVTVTQTFANPSAIPLNATYLFPLNKSAAVFAMKMQVSDEIVTAVIRKKEEARKTFEVAKRQGKAAALLEQHRPNMFTQEIANLMPGLPVTVTLSYTQTVPRVDGAYELVVPLVVGPRYRPNHHRASGRVAELGTPPQRGPGEPSQPETPAPASGQTSPRFGTWQLGPVPAYPEVSGLTIPESIETGRVSLTLKLRSGLPVQAIESPSHGIDVEARDAGRMVKLADSATLANRDFVLRYRLAGNKPSAGLLAHRDKRGGYFSLMLEPPAMPAADQMNAREIVFILDTSGSMSGKPIEASKTFMRHALRGLRPRDSFRIIQFSTNASEFMNDPVPATPENVAAGLAYVESLRASGGTEMMSGLKKAYSAAGSRDTLRLVVFLSDGYVSNEPEILRQVAANVGVGRMYAFGIGTAVNRYLMAEMARLGHGRHRIIDPTAKANEAAVEFANAIATPVLTDIEIDWGTLTPTSVTPSRIPDLFAGDNIRIQGRFAKGGAHVIRINGRVNGRTATMPLKIDLPAEGTAADAPAIPLIWARSRVADEMRELMVPDRLRASSRSDDDLKRRITQLGLDYAIVTQWTSFVAVAMKLVNPDPASARDGSVPLPMVEGVGPKAYGKQPRQRAGQPVPALPEGGIRAQLQPMAPKISGAKHAFGGAAAQAFGGGATPEPEHIFGLGLIVLLLWARFRQIFRRRQAA